MSVQIEKVGTPLEIEILELLEVISPVSFSDMRSFVINQVEESIKRGYSMTDLRAFLVLEPVNERIINKNMSFFKVKVVNPWASVSKEYKENPFFDFTFTKEKNIAVDKYKEKRDRLNKIILGAPSPNDSFSDIELKPKIVPEKDTFSAHVSPNDLKKAIDCINSLPTEKEVNEYVERCIKKEKTERLFDPNEYWNREGENVFLKDNTEKKYFTGRCSPGEM